MPPCNIRDHLFAVIAVLALSIVLHGVLEAGDLGPKAPRTLAAASPGYALVLPPNLR